MRTSNITREQALALLREYNKEGFHIQHGLTKVLFAADELTGLIWAAALMRPSKSVMDMEVSSVKKKFKDKQFAAGCSRDVIRRGAEMLGWELNELFEKTILAMRSCEESVKDQMSEMGY